MFAFSIVALIATLVAMILAIKCHGKYKRLYTHYEAMPQDDYEEKKDKEKFYGAMETVSSFSTACRYSAYGLFASALVLAGGASLLTVPAGHVKVASLFGKVQTQPFEEGIHMVNPLFDWALYDNRQKTHKESAGIPSADKLITKIDVSVQYRVIASAAPSILKNTGTVEDVIRVHLIPKLRSVLREQGKSVALAQDFFLEATQTRLQLSLHQALSTHLLPKGIQVDNILIRNIVLPPVINDAIEDTKKREQEIIKQQAELDRFAKEQQQLVATAQSKYDAALLQADKIRALADAEAYRVKTEYTGRAEGVDLLKKQLTPEYIQYLQAQTWNGVLPQFTGGDTIPMIDLRNKD